MKNLKLKLSFSLIAVAIATLAISWVLNNTTAMRSKAFSGATTATTVTHVPAANSGKDTMVGAGAVHRDTGIVWVWTPNNISGETFDLYVTQLTGSVTACSISLQGINDTTGIDWHDPTLWHNITPVNTYCGDCLSTANTTTVPGASKHYIYWVPPGTENWRLKRIYCDFTGTFTATYAGKMTTGDQ